MPSKYHIRDFRVGGFYHLYNRGANKLEIFKDDDDHETFLEIIDYYFHYPDHKSFGCRQKSVDTDASQASSFQILAFCLMPNHFHFLFHQHREAQAENSIINFMRRLSVTYALYMNKKHERSGVLFQGRYKNVVVRSNPELYQLSRYIHRNPIPILAPGKTLATYRYSSYPDYLGWRNLQWLKPAVILERFTNFMNFGVRTAGERVGWFEQTAEEREKRVAASRKNYQNFVELKENLW